MSIIVEKAKILLQQKRYKLIFLVSSVFYLFLSLILIRYFYVGFQKFFQQGWLAYADLLVTLLIAFFFGINFMFVVYTFLNLKRYANQAGIGIFATVISFFVAGCPACSLTLISLVVPYVGAALSLPVFPFKGLEIQLVGLLIMVVSLFFVSRDLECKV